MIVKNGLLGKRRNVVTIEATADLAAVVKLLADDDQRVWLGRIGAN
jgi:hypothetical protein